ncbi:MAG: flagellar hook-associated protein FlgK [Candidatus Muirbacterium halophilum]|nr:flagellar hook-associated protein FlgK [Candidatus Muirbacterium halophilum]
MISTFMGFEIAKSAITSSRLALDVTAHNIANANTEGYTRQRADLASANPFTTPSMQALAFPGQIGQGVTVSQITRIKMDFFDARFQQENQKFARYESLYQNLQQVELLINEPSDNGIRSVLDRFWQGLEDVSNDPETPATRRVVIENGVSLSNSFAQTYEELQGLKENINTEIFQRVDEVNRIVEEVSSLNQKITSIKNVNNNPNDLLDKRDKLLDDLSELVNIATVYKGTEDELVVSVNGRPIIQGQHYNKLVAVENRDNEDMVDVRWEKDYIPQSSNKDILTVFANSSAINQSHTINVKQTARKSMIEGNIYLPYEEKNLNYIGNTEQTKRFTGDGATEEFYINNEYMSDNMTVSVNGMAYTKVNDPNELALNPNSYFADKATGSIVFDAPVAAGDDIIVGIKSEFTPGHFEINGKKIYVDPSSDTLNDIIDYINDSGSGVKAKLYENRIILESANSGLDNQIKLNSGNSNFLRKMGLVNGLEGTTEFVEKEVPLNFATVPPGTYTIGLNGKNLNIKVDPLSGDSLQNIADNINKSDAGVKAIIQEQTNGNFRLILEGTDGDYNFTIDDKGDGTILSALGIFYGNELPNLGTPPYGKMIMGNMVSDECVEDIYKRGIGLGINSQFEIEDSNGNIATIDINSTNDSLALMVEEINNQLVFSGVDGKAEIIKDAEGKSRLYIESVTGGEIAIRDNSGNILENLGVSEGTYNGMGPKSFYGRNAIFNYDGADTEWSSNRVEGLIPDVEFTIRGTGQANIDIRKVLSGGKLKGLLESRDEVVKSYMNELDELAYSIMHGINSEHFKGFGSDNKSQRSFFDSYSGTIDGYPQKGAALSMGVKRNLQLDVTQLAAAARDNENNGANGLPISSGVGSGKNALNMANLKFAMTMDSGTATFNEFFNQTVSEIGTQANEVRRINDNQTLLIEKLENVRQQVSGVSLDEEMTNMVKFQHTYNAAAKIISTMDSMLNTIINLIR